MNAAWRLVTARGSSGAIAIIQIEGDGVDEALRHMGLVNAGTAITVDFVDGEGVFHGGAIGPGVRMMLRSLHEGASALPLVETIEDVVETQGRDTRSAMVLGVLEFARGGVHRLIERYAQAYAAYPQIVATGGDAALLFRDDDVIEHVVADLQLMGIHEACRQTLSGDDD